MKPSASVNQKDDVSTNDTGDLRDLTVVAPEYASDAKAAPQSDVKRPSPVGPGLNQTQRVEIRKLLQHSTQYSLGVFGVMLLGFISFPIFTRVFSVSEYGLLDLVLKVILLLTALSKMGIQNSAVRFYDEETFRADTLARQQYYSTLFFGVLLTATGVAAFFLLTIYSLPTSVIGEPLKWLISCASVLLLLRALQSILCAFFQSEGRTKAYNVTLITIKAGTIGLVCLLLWLWERSIRSFIVGSAIVELIVIIATIFLLIRGNLLTIRRVSPRLFAAALMFGSPLIVYELVSIFLDSGDRILVQYYLGPEALGYYSAAYNASSYIHQLLMVPLSLALLPLCLKLWAKEGPASTRAFLNRALDLFLLVAIGILAGVVVTCRDALIVLASQKYQQAYPLVPVVTGALLLYTTHIFLSAGLLIHRQTVKMAKLVLFCSALNIGLNCFLLRHLGVNAAALATLISYAVFVVLMKRAASAILPVAINYQALALYCAAGLISASISILVTFGSPLIELLIRAALSLSLYVGVLWFCSPNFRDQIRYLSPSRFQRFGTRFLRPA